MGKRRQNERKLSAVFDILSAIGTRKSAKPKAPFDEDIKYFQWVDVT